MFSIAFVALSVVVLKWAYNKDKVNKNKQILKARKKQLHKQFMQAKKWAEEI